LDTVRVGLVESGEQVVMAEPDQAEHPERRDNSQVGRPLADQVGDERPVLSGARRSRTSNVIAMANTLSLKASTRRESLTRSVMDMPRPYQRRVMVR